MWNCLRAGKGFQRLGVYKSNRIAIKITLEENIADINVKDENKIIKGRMDVLAVTKTEANIQITPLWVVLIETKNSSIDAMENLPNYWLMHIKVWSTKHLLGVNH